MSTCTIHEKGFNNDLEGFLAPGTCIDIDERRRIDNIVQSSESFAAYLTTNWSFKNDVFPERGWGLN